MDPFFGSSQGSGYTCGSCDKQAGLELTGLPHGARD